MQTKYVRVLCDVHCNWVENPPRYRVFVNDELFTERTWIWQDFYLEEALQIEAPPGEYHIMFQLIDNSGAELKVKNARIDEGPAVMHKHLRLEIL
jgi:hypothetical protein